MVGADDIPAQVYKNGSPTFFRVLAGMFNKTLGNTFFALRGDERFVRSND